MKHYFLLVVVAVLMGCNAKVAPPLVASDVVVTPPRPGARMSAGYLTIHNNSREAIVLTSVTSPQYGRVEIHETIIENDIARMRPLDGLAIPAGQSATLEPGGKHLMLMQPQESMQAVTLEFYAGEQLMLSVSATGSGE